MIEENQKFYNRFLAFIDAVIICVSYWLAWYFRYRSTLLFSSSFEAVPQRVYMRALYFVEHDRCVDLHVCAAAFASDILVKMVRVSFLLL